jgi:hypothetical protein
MRQISEREGGRERERTLNVNQLIRRGRESEDYGDARKHCRCPTTYTTSYPHPFHHLRLQAMAILFLLLLLPFPSPSRYLLLLTIFFFFLGSYKVLISLYLSS